MLFCPATAHLMHAKNHRTHLTCFMFDYAGIGFYAYGSSSILIYSCSPIWFYKLIEPYLLLSIGFHCALCFLLAAFSHGNYLKRPFPRIKCILQLCPLALLWTSSMLIPFSSLFLENDDALTINYANHGLHACVFVLGVSVFAGEFPQRFFPGKLDFFGQGHHWFHFCTLITNVLQIKSCYTDFLANRNVIAPSRHPPSAFVYCSIVVVMSVYFVYVIKCTIQSKRLNFDQKGNFSVNKIQMKN